MKEHHIWTPGNMRYCLQKILEDASPCPVCKSTNINLLGSLTSGGCGNRYSHVEYECENKHIFRKLLIDEIVFKEAKIFLARFGEDLFAKFSRVISHAEHIMTWVRTYHLIQSIDMHPIDSEKISLFLFWGLSSTIHECSGDHNTATLTPVLEWCNNSTLTKQIIEQDYYKRLTTFNQNVRKGKYTKLFRFLRNWVFGHVDLNQSKLSIDCSIDNDELVMSYTAFDNTTYNASVLIGASTRIANMLFEKVDVNEFIKLTSEVFKYVPDDINHLFTDVINIMPGAYKHIYSRELVKSFSYVVPEYKDLVSKMNNYI